MRSRTRSSVAAAFVLRPVAASPRISSRTGASRSPLSGAEKNTGLIYWATIDDITIDEESRTTACTYSDLRSIVPYKPKSSLRLRSTGQPISEDFIRPYAVCRTPAFLAETSHRRLRHAASYLLAHAVVTRPPQPTTHPQLTVSLRAMAVTSCLGAYRRCVTYPRNAGPGRPAGQARPALSWFWTQEWGV